MVQGPPAEPPESVILGSFSGMKNTVGRERLTGAELERAINIDLDDAGQVRRRRGMVRKIVGSVHSVRTIAERVLGVVNGDLSEIHPDYSTRLIIAVGPARVTYAAVAGEIFFCNAAASGRVGVDNVLRPWGRTNGQGIWLSPVINQTETLGAVAGKLIGDPIRATEIEAYSGRIYLADGKTLWVTELYRYDQVDRTKNFMQFEDDITLVKAMDDGLYVGTAAALYFLKGRFGNFQLTLVVDAAVLPGSGQFVPTELVHPQARNSPMPTGVAMVCMTDAGIVVGLDGGTVYNLTSDTMIFPKGVSAASLFRRDQGVSSYVAAVDNAGGPSASARIGDYVEAEIVRRP